jgi:hypothetical protein
MRKNANSSHRCQGCASDPLGLCVNQATVLLFSRRNQPWNLNHPSTEKQYHHRWQMSGRVASDRHSSHSHRTSLPPLKLQHANMQFRVSASRYQTRQSERPTWLRPASAVLPPSVPPPRSWDSTIAAGPHGRRSFHGSRHKAHIHTVLLLRPVLTDFIRVL